METPVVVVDDDYESNIPEKHRLPGLKEPLCKPGEGPVDKLDEEGVYRGY